MNRTLTIILALAAGLLGGMLSRYMSPTTAFAKVQSTVPKEIRAQGFTLVNEDGVVLGEFTIDGPATIRSLDQKGSYATLKLFDDSGHEIFRAGAPHVRLVDPK